MGSCSSCLSPEDEKQEHRSLLKMSLAERRSQAKEKRRKAKTLVHNLVHEEFGRDINEIYDVDSDVIGEGIQGVVRVIRHKETGQKYAMKMVPLGAGMHSKAMAQLRSEIDLIRGLDHPNIVKIQEVFETEDSLYLVMDLCTGGDMMSRWENNQGLKYSEDEAAKIVRKIMGAVRYCHDRNVVHRDIKLENLVWEHPGEDAEPQLIDFGLGVQSKDENEVFRDDVGSIYYVAPEVLARNYTKACDCWSVGILTYMLLAGMPPFLAPSDEGIKIKIRWTKVPFPKETFGKISSEAKDFIKRLLVKDPNKRMTATEAIVHPWIAKRRPSFTSGSDLPVQAQPTEMELEAREGGRFAPLDPEIVRRLKRFGDFGILKRVAFGVIAHSLTLDQRRSLRAEFQKLDVEGRGEISLHDFEKAIQSSGNFSTKEIERMFANMDMDSNGKIGFTEFVAASIRGEQVTGAMLHKAFDRMDEEKKNEVTMENLMDVTGATVDEDELQKQVTDVDLQAALFDREGGGVSYDVFRRVMMRNSSILDLTDAANITRLVRAGSKLSVPDLAAAVEGTEEEAMSIKNTSNVVMESMASTADHMPGLEAVPEGSAEPQVPDKRVSSDQQAVSDAGAPRS